MPSWPGADRSSKPPVRDERRTQSASDLNTACRALSRIAVEKNDGVELGAAGASFENLDRRIRRMEDIVTAPDYDWDRRLNE